MHHLFKGRCVACVIASGLVPAAMAQNAGPPLPTGALVESAIASGQLRADLDPPLAGSRDFQGVWYPAATPARAGAPDGGAPPGGAPREGGAPPGDAGEALRCLPRQVAFAAGGGFAFGIVQSPDTMVLMNEETQNYRIIFLDGRHPAELPTTRNGHSIGHWEGNTLVVDTIGAVGRDGKPGAHTIERVRKSDDGSQLIVELSAADLPAIGTPARTQASRLQWRPDLFISESVCEESYAEFTVVNGMVVLTQQVQDGAKK